jgi:hypothetical protein
LKEKIHKLETDNRQRMSTTYLEFKKVYLSTVNLLKNENSSSCMDVFYNIPIKFGMSMEKVMQITIHNRKL